MNCEDFSFNSKVNMNLNAYLGNDCTRVNNSSQRLSDYFTGYDKLTVNKTGSNCGIICEYDSIDSSNYVRSTLLCGENTLNSDKYYRISGPSTYDLNLISTLSKCVAYTPVESLKIKLNSTNSNDFYNNISIIIPFLIFLIIFSFSYSSLRKVIKSSSRGDIDV